ncbi:unnamed protein product, partial [Symbiodinium pilosum]
MERNQLMQQMQLQNLPINQQQEMMDQLQRQQQEQQQQLLQPNAAMPCATPSTPTQGIAVA